jgi:Fe2+ or Zn2+ uptake regulation protein
MDGNLAKLIELQAQSCEAQARWWRRQARSKARKVSPLREASTFQRRVYQALWEDWQTVSQISAYLRQQHGKIDVPNVYAALYRLEELGLVERHHNARVQEWRCRSQRQAGDRVGSA